MIIIINIYFSLEAYLSFSPKFLIFHKNDNIKHWIRNRITIYSGLFKINIGTQQKNYISGLLIN